MSVDITLSWNASSDPDVGFRIYFSVAGAVLAETAQASPSSRSFTLHNINPGLVEVGVSRVDNVNVGGTDTPIESDIVVAALIVPDVVVLPTAPTSVTLAIT